MHASMVAVEVAIAGVDVQHQAVTMRIELLKVLTDLHLRKVILVEVNIVHTLEVHVQKQLTVSYLEGIEPNLETKIYQNQFAIMPNSILLVIN